MVNFFGFLLLAAVVALLAGLIKPALVVFWRKPATRAQALAYAGLAVVALLGIGLTAPPPTAAEQAAIDKKKTDKAAASQDALDRQAEEQSVQGAVLATKQRKDSAEKAREKLFFDARVAVRVYLENNLDDPNIEELEQLPLRRASTGVNNTWYMPCRYRMRNEFGALVLKKQLFKINDEG